MFWQWAAEQVGSLPKVGKWAEEIIMLEFSRILTAFSATLAGVAFTVYGIAHSVRYEPGWEETFGIWGMVLGVLGTIVGLVMHGRLAED